MICKCAQHVDIHHTDHGMMKPAPGHMKYLLPTYSKNLLVPCRAGLKVRGQNLCAISRKKSAKNAKSASKGLQKC